ncbi:hypothetical protein OAL01_02330 [Rubripirellula sp.]|nr:hypothetical protein [Rubripirellula sp.]
MGTQLRQVNKLHRVIGEKVAKSAELLETDNEVEQVLSRDLRERISKTRSGEQQSSHLNRRALMATFKRAENDHSVVGSRAVKPTPDCWQRRMPTR